MLTLILAYASGYLHNHATLADLHEAAAEQNGHALTLADDR